jgi:phenylalanine-4-hydroxylase
MEAMMTTQHYATYTAEDHAVWRELYRRRMRSLESTASRVFLEGMRAIGLEQDRVPELAEVNSRLRRRTGWEAVPVTGFLPAEEFFACLARRRFPTTVTLRSREQLDYVEAPDIFHDVFGHVPMHADPAFARFLQRFGERAAVAGPGETERLARLFWFTVEFGLVREEGALKIYGSGLISSHADAANALGPECERRPFVLEEVLEQSFAIDHVQPLLYVIDSFDQLLQAI